MSEHRLGTATYSPDDNKLRLYPFARLSTEDYTRAKEAGFSWAPKQELFVAPMWTPEREDLLLEWCGEIGDEDKSLVERAEERAERFEDYSEKRAEEAHSAKQAVESIAGGIPLGQPILVGHHSQRRAEKDAERIENGMRRAVKLWDTSKYWTQRAAGALAHAKYKEEPDVRARRIKRIEADQRKIERAKAESENLITLWEGKAFSTNRATGERRQIEISEANRAFLHQIFGRMSACGVQFRGKDGQGWYSAYDIFTPDGERYKNCPDKTVAEVQEAALRLQARLIERYNRWLFHYDNRLAYERAMLAESGGLVADKFSLAVGGQVLRRGKWHIIIKLNGGTMGKPQSVSVIGHWASTFPVEEIEDYKAPKEGDFEKVKAVTAKPPLCNYPGGEVLLLNRYHPREPDKSKFATITQAEWDKIPKDYKGQNQIVLASDKHARHRVRICLGTYAKLPPPAGRELEPGYVSANRTHRYWPVYITDAKLKLPPEPDGKPAPQLPEREIEPRTFYKRPDQTPEQTGFEALREAAKQGVQAVSSNQLFPTPPEIAKQMVDRAGILAGRRVLEPSAGTGRLIEAAASNATGFDCFKLVAVEQNKQLASGLEAMRSKWLHATEENFFVVCSDFLQCNGNLGKFDVVLMNPPFENGSDIKHIEHALTFLKPGGKLVALCANGPRQQAKLQPMADSWENLPAGSFKASGTNVNVAMLTITKD